MEGAGPEGLECSHVDRRSVSLVFREPVSRPASVQLHHEMVTADLGDDRRGSDRRAAPVTADDRPGGAIEFGGMGPIDQREVGSAAQQADSSGHGFEGRAQDVDVVDATGRNSEGAPT